MLFWIHKENNLYFISRHFNGGHMKEISETDAMEFIGNKNVNDIEFPIQIKI